MTPASCVERNRQHIGIGPSVANPSVDYIAAHAGSFSPFCCRQRLSVKCKDVTATAILRLLLRCCPPNVSRLISLGAVDPIKRMFRGRARAHIIKKCGKGRVPTVADRNPFCPVSLVVSVFGIVASSPHSSPNAVLRSVEHSVRATPSRCHLSGETPTTARHSTYEERGYDKCFRAAFAAAPPSQRSLITVMEGNNGQAPEGLSSQVVTHNRTFLGKASRMGWGWLRESRLSAGHDSAQALFHSTPLYHGTGT